MSFLKIECDLWWCWGESVWLGVLRPSIWYKIMVTWLCEWMTRKVNFIHFIKWQKWPWLFGWYEPIKPLTVDFMENQAEAMTTVHQTWSTVILPLSNFVITSSWSHSTGCFLDKRSWCRMQWISHNGIWRGNAFLNSCIWDFFFSFFNL